MPHDTFIALLSLALATLFTPGPNNAMLASSGATFGFRRTVPHMLGVAIGFTAMVLVVGLALGEVFRASAMLRETLRWGGALILLWLAWKIAIAKGPAADAQDRRPMTFLQAAAFQWINPKAWPMAVAATSQFVAPDRPVETAMIVALVFLLLGLGSSLSWAYAGQAMTRWLTTDRRFRQFNLAMAALILLSVLAIIAG